MWPRRVEDGAENTVCVERLFSRSRTRVLISGTKFSQPRELGTAFFQGCRKRGELRAREWPREEVT
jgi:hypothetical protein